MTACAISLSHFASEIRHPQCKILQCINFNSSNCMFSKILFNLLILFEPTKLSFFQSTVPAPSMLEKWHHSCGCQISSCTWLWCVHSFRESGSSCEAEVESFSTFSFGLDACTVLFAGRGHVCCFGHYLLTVVGTTLLEVLRSVCWRCIDVHCSTS